MSLAGDLRDLRVALGLDLRRAASLCGTSAVDLGRIERDEPTAPAPGPLPVYPFVTMVHQLLGPTRPASRARSRRLYAKLARVAKAKGTP